MAGHLADVTELTGSQESEGVRVGVAVSEDTDEVDFGEKGGTAGKGENLGTHTDEKDLGADGSGLKIRTVSPPSSPGLRIEKWTHHRGHLHAAFNASALENSVKSIFQTLHRLHRIAGLQSLPRLTSSLQSLDAANSRAPRQAESACCPALLSGKVELALFYVDGNDAGASACSGEGAGEKTDSTSTNDKDSSARAEVSPSVGVENDREGLSKSCEGEFKARGEPREQGIASASLFFFG